MKTINPLSIATGNALIINPYIENNAAPKRLIHLNFCIEFISIEVAITIDAIYPIY